jgi:hypothetical protein
MLFLFYSCSLLKLSKGVFSHLLWNVHSYAVVKRTILVVLRPHGDSYRGVHMLFFRNLISLEARAKMSLAGVKKKSSQYLYDGAVVPFE